MPTDRLNEDRKDKLVRTLRTAAREIAVAAHQARAREAKNVHI